MRASLNCAHVEDADHGAIQPPNSQEIPETATNFALSLVELDGDENTDADYHEDDDDVSKAV